MAKQGDKEPGIGWFAKVLLVVAAAVPILFVFGLWLAYKDVQFARNAVPVRAEVIDVEFGTSSNGLRFSNSSTSYFPTFTFTDRDGVDRKIKSGGYVERFSIGEMRDVIYNPDDPNSPVRLKGWSVYKGYGALALYGTTPLLLMVAYGRWRGKREENRKRLRRNQMARERRARKKAEREKMEREKGSQGQS